jgi:hypothetical protein
MSDNNLAENVKKGHEAAAELNSPALKHAMLAAKARLIEKFIESKPDEQQVREDAYLQLKAMSALFEELTYTIQSGTMAQTDLETINKFNEEKNKLN